MDEQLPRDGRPPWRSWAEKIKSRIHGPFEDDDHIRLAFVDLPWHERERYIEESRRDVECYLAFTANKHKSSWERASDLVKWETREPEMLPRQQQWKLRAYVVESRTSYVRKKARVENEHLKEEGASKSAAVKEQLEEEKARKRENMDETTTSARHKEGLK